MKKTIFTLLTTGITLFSVTNLNAQVVNYGPGSGTGGDRNTFVGRATGNLSTGESNSFVGHNSGRSTTTANSNSFFGADSGRFNITGQANTYIGHMAGLESIQSFNTYIGALSAQHSTTGSQNSYLGVLTGRANNGFANVMLGYGAGYSSENVTQSVFIGSSAGSDDQTGKENVYIGTNTGRGYESSESGGKYNIALGSHSGFKIASGENNTYLGFNAGYNNKEGNRNIFIGSNAGYGELGSDKLYIENSNADIPLIYGDFTQEKVGINTKELPNTVGGANTSLYGLFVKGGILTDEVRVRTGWADYVFHDNYKLLPIDKVEAFITKNGHLPNVPSATQVENQGIELGDITRIQQEKIEELTLYIIELQKQLDAIKAKINM